MVAWGMNTMLVLFATAQPLELAMQPWAAELWTPLQLGGKQIMPLDLQLPRGASPSTLDIQAAMWKEAHAQAVRATDFRLAEGVETRALVQLGSSVSLGAPVPMRSPVPNGMPHGVRQAGKQGGYRTGSYNHNNKVVYDTFTCTTFRTFMWVWYTFVQMSQNPGRTLICLGITVVLRTVETEYALDRNCATSVSESRSPLYSSPPH
eukprot:1487945-Prymnesium_polylepis.2